MGKPRSWCPSKPFERPSNREKRGRNLRDASRAQQVWLCAILSSYQLKVSAPVIECIRKIVNANAKNTL